MRRNRSLFPMLFVGFLLFMMLGDYLPEPASGLSRQTKTTVNGFLIGLFPSWDPDLNPHQRTESQMRQMERN